MVLDAAGGLQPQGVGELNLLERKDGGGVGFGR